MDIAKVDQASSNSKLRAVGSHNSGAEEFSLSLAQNFPTMAGKATELPSNDSPLSAPELMIAMGRAKTMTSSAKAISAYSAQAATSQPMTGLQKYVDDQLLRNPGGHDYDLNEKKVRAFEGRTLAARVKNDLAAARDNVKNFIANMFFGARFCYRDENNQICEARHEGVLGSVIDFFKDLGSGCSLGVWRPGGEAEPQGVVKRLSYAFSKIYKAFEGDLLGGVSGAVNHMANDLLLAGWNLTEAIPDATVSNIPAGEKAVAQTFDKGQVLIDYAVDVLPSGEAWKRVHSFSISEAKVPVWNNVTKKEQEPGDPKWRYVRNTAFRKSIETIGAILVDVASVGISQWITGSSGNPNHKG